MTQIFVNLPVADLDASVALFTSLGWQVNPQFTNEMAACIVVSDTIYVMLLTRDFFGTFTDKPVADAKTSTEVAVALSTDSRDQVDQLVDSALLAGATEAKPVVDMGFMYQRAFDDLDGHLWEIFWMDPAHIQ